MARHPNTPESFWAHVRKDDHPKGCWEWTGTFLNRGYGVLRWGGRTDTVNPKKLAHRISYAFAHPDWDGKGCVLHRCDNRLCVNPEHLFLGSRAINVADMREKGRGVNLRGAAHGMAKLTPDLVLAIYVDPLSEKLAAKKYGVVASVIGGIRRGTIWKTVPRDHLVVPVRRGPGPRRRGEEARPSRLSDQI